MTHRRTMILVCLLVFAASSAFCVDAVMGRYDPQQTSYTSEKLEPPLSLLWDSTGNKYDNNPAAPAVADGVAYFACGDRVYAVDVETGSLKWKYPTDQGLGGSVKGTPAVSGGSVYFGAGDGNLYCVDAATGTFRWAYQTRGAIRCPPVIDEGIVYFGSDDNSLYGVQAVSGDAAPGWIKPFTARDDIAVGVAVSGGMAIVACMDGNVYGIMCSTGKARWIQRLPLAPSNTSPVIAGDLAVIAVGSQMMGLTARSGRLRWSVTLPSDAAATPAVDGNDIYVPCRDKKVYAYTSTGRQAIGKTNWTAPADLGAIPMSSPTVTDGIVYVTGSRGIIAGFSTVDGSCKWRYQVTPSAVTMPGSYSTDAASSPIVADGSLFVLTDDGVLHRFTDDAPDNSPPELYNRVPRNGSALSPVPPTKMSGLLYDIGSGIDLNSVALYLDGQPKPELKVDKATATFSYETEVEEPGKAAAAKLSDGVHTITVTAKDYRGNLLTDQWTFIADSSLPPPRRSKPADDTGKKTKEPPKRTTPAPAPTPPMVPPMPEMPGGPGGQPPPPPGMPGPGGPGPGGPYGPGGMAPGPGPDVAADPG